MKPGLTQMPEGVGRQGGLAPAPVRPAGRARPSSPACLHPQRRVRRLGVMLEAEAPPTRSKRFRPQNGGLRDAKAVFALFSGDTGLKATVTETHTLGRPAKPARPGM